MIKNPRKIISLDDLVCVCPLKPDGTDYKKAILKLDFQGYEPYLFRRAKILFEKFDIQVVFMFWDKIIKNINVDIKQIDNMVEFLTEKRLLPYFNEYRLDLNNRDHWPRNIYWVKQ